MDAHDELFYRLNDRDPRIRDLAYLLFLEQLLGGKWVERWARERGKLDALREWGKGGADPGSSGPPLRNLFSLRKV